MINGPLEVRAHHLNTFEQFLSPGWTSAAYSEFLVNLRKIEKNSSDKRDYAEDVIGKSDEEARHVQRHFETVFNRFVNLNELDPILITIGKKDGICDGCHHGAHCDARGLELAMGTSEGPKRVFASDIDDMFALSAFLKAGEALKDTGIIEDRFGFPENQTGYATVPSAEATPIIASNMITFQPPVLTNAGFVRAVLHHSI